MNLFWYLLSGLAFAVSCWYFVRVLMRPSNTMKHLYEITAGYAATMLTGCWFCLLLAVAILK